jgi:hypothetical protein
VKEFDVHCALEFVVRVEAETSEQAREVAARSNIQSEGELVSGPIIIGIGEMTRES